VTDYLSWRRFLLVLDNFEHLLDAAPVVTDLLGRSPRLVVLVTSRAALRVAGEHDVPVPPLAVPDLDHLARTEEIVESAAIRLFAARARAADPAFALTAENAPAVAAVCDRLDGLPLAIELAAARCKVLPPAALLPRLARRLPLLTAGRRDAPVRHRTMRDAIAWSHDLLPEEIQVLFRRLAVFVGGFTLDAAEAVCGGRDLQATSCLDGLSTLVDHRLVHQHIGVGGEPRFGMLETIREYAEERLGAGGDEREIRDAHAAWCLDLAEQAAPFWFTSAQPERGDILEVEHDNLRAALAWSARLGGTRAGFQLAGRLWPFWFVRGHHAEGADWLERALAWLEGGEATAARVRALTGAACFARGRGDWSRSTDLGEEAVRIAAAIGADAGIDAAHALVGLGLTAANRGEWDQAIAINERVLAILRGIGEREPSAAPMESVLLDSLATIALMQEDVDRAMELVEAALAIQRRCAFGWGAADSFYVLALIARDRGDTVREAAYLGRSLAMAWDYRDPQSIVVPIEGLALLASASHHHEAAARLHGAADLLYERLGAPASSEDGEQRAREAAIIRDALGDAGSEGAKDAGRRMTLDRTVTEALMVANTLAPGTVDQEYVSAGDSAALMDSPFVETADDPR
jgi:predicted ATPase